MNIDPKRIEGNTMSLDVYLSVPNDVTCVSVPPRFLKGFDPNAR